jgi:membrane protease YdiL (CAAX protease family)
MALKYTCRECGESIITKFLKPGESAKCRKCETDNVVPHNALTVETDQADAYLETRASPNTDWNTIKPDIGATKEAPPQVKWVRHSLVLAILAAILSSIYLGLFELFNKCYPVIPPYMAEFMAVATALLLSLLLLKAYSDRDALGLDLTSLFSLRPFKRMALVLGAGAVADFAASAVFLALIDKYYPDQHGNDLIRKVFTSHHNWFFVFTNTTFLASCEEIMLRGLIFSYIKKHTSYLKALLVSSVFFSLMHIGNTWLALVLIFINGLIYCTVFEKTRSLAAPCLIHGLHNSVLRVILLLP